MGVARSARRDDFPGFVGGVDKAKQLQVILAEISDHTRWGERGQTSTQVIELSRPIRSWLYLPVVGLPSISRAGYALVYREVTGRQWTRYYEGFPERWADRLGGVSRDKEQV